MCHGEEEGLPLVFGLLPYSVVETFRVTGRTAFLPIVIKMYETGTAVSSRWLPLQSGVKTRTKFPKCKENDGLYGREFKGTRSVA